MATLGDISNWLDDQSVTEAMWYVKRLAANDTLASGSHQAGPYIPKEFLFSIFPALNTPESENPEVRFPLYIDSHSDAREVRAVWYNNRLRGGTRNETRLTNLGGSASALLDPEVTGSLAIFSFYRATSGQAANCHVWVCDHEVEEDQVEDRIGPVEPGTWKIWNAAAEDASIFSDNLQGESGCRLQAPAMPSAWLSRFPSGAEIVRKSVELRAYQGLPVDLRLIKRRKCEYELFKSVEEAIELPAIHRGFANMDDFIAFAQNILQRRKSRSGRSLELQTREIFLEENLREGIDFQHLPESDPGKRPDFIFPSATAYQDEGFPSDKLRMLAVKTTCKDRWRQILTEASRVSQKHLLTLQEGVSEAQFQEMVEAKVQLVVPEPLITTYPGAIRHQLQTLESFIGDVRLLKTD
jgi:hypothetical protein